VKRKILGRDIFMKEIIKDGQLFVGYEYKQVVTNKNKVSFMTDGYKNFGWVIDENMSQSTTIDIQNSYAPVVLQLKRDRKIMNKMELTRLEKNFEFCLKEIDYLEKSKSAKAMMYGLSVGIVGTIFMAGSVFAVTAEPPMIPLCIILAVPAFAGWILPYFIYKEVERKRTIKVKPLIEEKREEIYEICEKGNKQLNGR
jgi:hypothetical protein